MLGGRMIEILLTDKTQNLCPGLRCRDLGPVRGIENHSSWATGVLRRGTHAISAQSN